MLHETQCPKCGSSWDGGSILETFIKQRDEGASVWQGKSDEELEEYVKSYYGEPYRWGRQIGISDMNTDRTEEVACPDCHSVFNRFTGEDTGRKLEMPKQNEEDI